MPSFSSKVTVDHARTPLFNSFRKYSTVLTSQLIKDKTLTSCQPSTTGFQEMILSFEESKHKAHERRKSKTSIKITSTDKNI